MAAAALQQGKRRASPPPPTATKRVKPEPPPLPQWLGPELHLRHTYIMFSCTHFLFRVRIFNVLALFCCGSDLFLRRVRAVASVLLSARTVHLPGPSGGVSHAALLLLLLLLPLCAWPGPVSCGCLNVRSLVGGTGTGKIFFNRKSPQRPKNIF